MSRLEALLSLTGAGIIIGSTLVISRIISKGESVFVLQLISMLIASLVLYALIGRKKLKEDIKNIGYKDYGLLFLQTLTGVILFRVFIVYGVGLTRATDAGVILSLTPIMTITLSVLFLKEKLGRREMLAMSCAFIGVLIINLNGVQNLESQGVMRLIGNGMIILAVTGESAFVIFSKKASLNISPLTKSFLICLLAMIMFLPLSIYELTKGHEFIFQSEFWFLSIYYGVVLTVMAYVLWFRGIAHVSGTTAGVINSFIPVSSIILVYIVLGEKINRIQLIGLVFILTGVALIIFSKEEKRDMKNIEIDIDYKKMVP